MSITVVYHYRCQQERCEYLLYWAFVRLDKNHIGLLSGCAKTQYWAFVRWAFVRHVRQIKKNYSGII